MGTLEDGGADRHANEEDQRDERVEEGAGGGDANHAPFVPQAACHQVFRGLPEMADGRRVRASRIADVGHAREQAEKFVRLADIVKASDEDLAWLYPGVDPLESARTWLGLGPALVVVTRGGDGPWAVCAAGETQCPAPGVEVVDTVGAGDSFMAALLGAVVDRELDGGQRREELNQVSAETLGAMINYAAKAAAITVSRAGANPPSRTELSTHAG